MATGKLWRQQLREGDAALPCRRDGVNRQLKILQPNPLGPSNVTYGARSPLGLPLFSETTAMSYLKPFFSQTPRQQIVERDVRVLGMVMCQPVVSLPLYHADPLIPAAEDGIVCLSATASAWLKPGWRLPVGSRGDSDGNALSATINGW